MNDVFWFQGKLFPIDDGSFSEWNKYLPLPLKSIAEIHYNSPFESQQNIFIRENTKYWVSANAFFDTTLLLINRMLGSNLESMLIFEEINRNIVFGLFGRAALVGRYNLPPEFEIHTSGWMTQTIFSDWFKKSEPKPQIITVESEIPSIVPFSDQPTARSLLEAFLLAKGLPHHAAPWCINSPGKNTFSYITLERI